MRIFARGSPGALPLGNRRRLRQLVDALPDQHAHQRRGHALAHRPALERRVRGDARRRIARRSSRPFHVTTNAAVISAAGSNAASTACFTFAASSPAGSGSVGSTSPIGQGCVEGSGSALLTCIGREVHRRLSDGQRHASLAAQILRRARHAVRERDVHGLGRAIDHRLADLRALRVGAGEVADVLGGEVGIEPGDEHRRAHDLREARRVVLERIARRRHVRRVELEGLRPRDERAIGRARIRCRQCSAARRWPSRRALLPGTQWWLRERAPAGLPCRQTGSA